MIFYIDDFKLMMIVTLAIRLSLFLASRATPHPPGRRAPHMD